MKKPFKIGITGGIGSGKSLVCKIFKCLHIPVYDADNRARSLMTTDGILISQIKKEFGDLSYDNLGNLNRQYLGEVVFSNEEKLSQLNALVHPRVAHDFEQWAMRHENAVYVLKEAALLFEAGSYRELDRVIVVSSPLELRISRVLARDPHRSRQQLEDIIKRQWPETEKLKLADHVLQNDESHLLMPQVLKLHDEFQRLAC